VFIATAGLRRFAQRLGKVVIVAGVVVVICSLSAYKAEHPTNPGFATIGDSLWWGIVTLTTVGYGDIVPKTTAGRFAGIAIMFTGVAVLGVLAGSLASLFGIGAQSATPSDDGAVLNGGDLRPLHEELAELRAQLQGVEDRLGRVADRARSLA
jgi:voltage-gated potassium channel